MTTTPTNLRQFPARVGAKVGIVIDLDHLRAMMEKFLTEMNTRGHTTTYGADSLTDWKFETFLQWLRRRQETTNGNRD